MCDAVFDVVVEVVDQPHDVPLLKPSCHIAVLVQSAVLFRLMCHFRLMCYFNLLCHFSLVCHFSLMCHFRLVCAHVDMFM